MLKKLRNKKTAKKIWIALAVLVLPAFILWGSGSLVRNKEEPTFVGKIFGKKITSLEFKDSLNAIRTQAMLQFGDKYSEAEKFLDLEGQAWDRLIILSAAKKRKIKIPDQEVISLIQGYPFFQRKGAFDNQTYSEVVHYAFRLSPRQFEEQMRQNLMLAELYRQVTNAIKVSDQEIREEYKKANEEISVYYIAALFSEFGGKIAPEEKELKDYFTKNPTSFKQPATLNLEYLLAESAEKITQASLALKKKQDLNSVAKDLGLTIKETGFFSARDPVPGIGWSPEILDLISKLKPGQISEPVNLDKNYYLFRLKETKVAYVPEFNQIKDKIKEAFLKDRAKKIAGEKIQECLKKLKEFYKENSKVADFTKTAKQFGLKTDATANFKYASYIEGIGSTDNFWLAAQDLKEDDFSEAIEMPSGYYIIRLKSKAPLDEKLFPQKKPEYEKQLLSQKKQQYFSQYLEQLKKGASLP